MQNKKWLSMLLCLLLAMTMLLTGCGEQNTGDPETKPETESADETVAEEDPLVTLLPDTQYNSEFVIFSANGDGLVSFEEDGEPINSKIVERTLYLEERFKLAMSSTASGSVDQIKTSHMAGGGEFDLIWPHPTDGIVDLMISGVLADLHDMEYQYLDQPWWNQSQVENYTANGKLYLGVNDMTITWQSLLGLVYNRDKYKDYGFEDDLHDVAMAKDFTVEYLETMLMNCQTDVNGEGESSIAEYGLLFQTNSSRRWMWALGERILNKNSDGVFEVALKADSLTKMCSALYGLLYESGDVLVEATGPNATFPSSNLWTTFESGRALMTTFNIGSLYPLLRELDFDIGYLPLPKLNDEQEDYLVVEASGMIAIPAVPRNLEMSSAVLEAFAIISYQDLRPTFFDVILMGRLSENPDDYEMLEFLHSSKFYDIGFTLDSNEDALGIINAVVVDKKAPDSAAIYLRSKKNLIDAIATLANTID